MTRFYVRPLILVSIVVLVGGCAAPGTETEAPTLGPPVSPTPPPLPTGMTSPDDLAPSPTTTPEGEGPVASATPSPSGTGGETLILGVNQVRDVTFTGADVLWAATMGGAVRWDLDAGSHVQYTAADGLVASRVTDVAEAPDGSLWFATLGGVSRFHEGAWTSYTEADGLVDDGVQSIVVTDEGIVWAGTTQGVSRFDGASWTTYLPGDRAWDIAVAPDGAVWFATDAAGLRRYTPDDDTWETYTTGDDQFAPGVKTAAVDPEGNVWSYLGYDQVTRFDGQDWEPVYDAPWACDVAFEPDGTPWIATCSAYRTYGAGLVTRADGSWRQVTREEGVASDSVQAVAIGPGGQIAAGTNCGLSVYRDGVWQTLRDGPALNRITTVAVTPDGAAWFGFGDTSFPSPGGGVSRYDGQAWEWFDQTTGLAVNDNVTLLAVGPDGRLWAGAGCELGYRADGAWHRAAGCDDFSRDAPAGNVIDVAFEPDGGVWVATGFGVHRFDGEAWTTWDGLLPTSIAVTAAGTVLIRQSPLGEGLLRRVDGAWEAVTPADGVPAGQVADVAVSMAGEVFVAAEGGIGHLRPDGWDVHGRTWVGDVREMAVAPDGSVWLATSYGAVHAPALD